MAAVREWITGFLVAHRERFSPPDWPPDGSDEYREYTLDWIEAFAGPGVSEDEATRASRRLALKPPRWKREHIPAVVETIAAMRADRAPAGGDPNSREAAAAHPDSRNCPWCASGGRPSGQVTVWHRAPCLADRLPETVLAHCSCPYGRWVRRRNREQSPETAARTPDLVAVLADEVSGRGEWLSAPPAPPIPLRRIYGMTWPERQEAERLAARGERPTPEAVASDPILARDLKAF